MKISDIIVENQQQSNDPSLASLRQLFSHNPELLSYIQRAYQSPRSSGDMGLAIDIGTAEYEASKDKKAQKSTSRNTATKDKNAFRVDPKQNDNELRKDSAGRTLRHQRYYSDKSSDSDLGVAQIADKAKQVAYSAIPGAQELGQAVSKAATGFTKGFAASGPTNKGKGSYKKR